MVKKKVETKVKKPKELNDLEKIHKKLDELKKTLSKAKSKFNKLDSKTKKKIITGVAASLVLIAGAIKINKLKKAKKTKK